ncbi:MAG: hypothetical protein ACREBU_24840 [Nitrososphaera sp.]
MSAFYSAGSQGLLLAGMGGRQYIESGHRDESGAQASQGRLQSSDVRALLQLVEFVIRHLLLPEIVDWLVWFCRMQGGTDTSGEASADCRVGQSLKQVRAGMFCNAFTPTLANLTKKTTA